MRCFDMRILQLTWFRVFSEWLTEKELAHLHARKVAATSRLKQCHGSLGAAMTAAAPEDRGIDREIFSVFVLVAGALASHEACNEKRQAR